MRESVLFVTFLLFAGFSDAAGQSVSVETRSLPSASSVPIYRVVFEKRDAVPGVSSTPGIKLPFNCTADGTIFVSFVGGVPAKSGLLPPLTPPMELVAVSPDSHGQTFGLDQVPELKISREVDHFASDSEVVFLLTGHRDSNSVKRTVLWGKEGDRREYTGQAAEPSFYLVTFDRDGKYKRTIEINGAFNIQHVGLFSSGVLLALGFDVSDHSPKLAMLKDDGTVLKFIEIPKGVTPESMGELQGSPHPVTAMAEFVAEGRSIFIVQNKTTFPLLEVNESGAIRAINPRLQKGEQIAALIPADRGLYVITKPETVDRASAEVIYEASGEDGSLVRRFELTDGRWASDVACVHDGKFLSIDYSDGRVVPLIGSPEPVASAGR
jgi:hypothetical protein